MGADVRPGDLTLFRVECLAAIAHLDAEQEVVNGLEVLETVANRLDVESRHGRIYPNLEWLIERELVEKQKVNGRTNAYSLTSLGTQALRFFGEWYSEALPTALRRA